MINDFGDLVLIIGDFNCPCGSGGIPNEFEKLLATNKIGHVLCTGNIGNDNIYNKIKNISPNNFHIVQGDQDFYLTESNTFQNHKVVKIGDFIIGLIHGHQIIPWGSVEGLIMWQRKLNCDILVSGFTHQNTAEKIEGKVYINPGSVTGAYKANIMNSKCPIVPSFMLMAIKESQVTLYVYELRNGEVKISMSEFIKNT